MTSSRIAGLDLARAVAITGVVVAHGALLWGRPIPVTSAWAMVSFGGYGVDLFFALSGWLIGGQLYDAFRDGTFSLREFWRRRWLRTVPAYLVFLVVTRITYLRYAPDEPLIDWRFLVYVQNLAWSRPPVFPESWSLSVEEWFYVLTPLLLLALRAAGVRPARAFGVVIGVLTFGSLLARTIAVCVFDLPMIDGICPVVIYRMDALAMGLGAVWLERQGAFDRPWVRTSLWMVGLVIIALSLRWIHLTRARGELDTVMGVRLWTPLLIPLGAAMLLPACAHFRTWPGNVSGRLVGGIALISYSLYLCNLTLLFLAQKAGQHLHLSFGMQVLIYLCGTLAVGVTSYRFIERPFIERYRRPAATALVLQPRLAATGGSAAPFSAKSGS